MFRGEVLLILSVMRRDILLKDSKEFPLTLDTENKLGQSGYLLMLRPYF